MAAIVFPGQPRRWGNESTNFYYASYTASPGVASRQKEYRCSDSQYANSGHYHHGTKALNLNPPLDKYGTAAAHKLRAIDQVVPKALTTSAVQCSMPQDPSVNLYQSHQQNYHNYAMATPTVQRLPSEEVGGDQAVTRSLNKAFYTTSYQSEIAKYAGQRNRPNSTASLRSSGPDPTPTLRDNLDTRHMKSRPARVKSAPPLRQVTPAPPTILPPTLLERRRSFTGPGRSYPSHGEMLKSIFTMFPAPEPRAVSRRAARPSSAVTLRAGKIPHLRK